MNSQVFTVYFEAEKEAFFLSSIEDINIIINI